MMKMGHSYPVRLEEANTTKTGRITRKTQRFGGHNNNQPSKKNNQEMDLNAGVKQQSARSGLWQKGSHNLKDTP